MAQSTKKSNPGPAVDTDEAFRFADPGGARQTNVHIYGEAKAVCATDAIGHAEPRGASREELVLDGTEGFIPLWAKDVTLRWRFNLDSLQRFARPDLAAAGLRRLMGEAVAEWGSAAPIQFVERNDAFDFEVSVREADRCSVDGCVLASAFFPDAGRHELKIYPKFFELPRREQVETLIHEFGHVFGLRHFFALVSETEWKAVIYGEHDVNKPFSIMNYGDKSVLTEADRRDLKQLYKSVWSGKLKKINGTRIKQMRPYHDTGSTIEQPLFALAALLRAGMPP